MTRQPPRAPRGNKRTCKTWAAEAAMRMLLNNLDPEVGEDPEHLVVYGGTGRAARSHECLEVILKSLQDLEPDETLLVQSGKPVGIFRTHEMSPRVLIANSHLVPAWATWDEFRRLEALGLTMYGQMTAGSWIYIGTQGILQGTYETFAAVGRQHFGGDLSGKLLVTGGLGGMGGAQPLAATMNGATCLGIEVDRRRMEKRVADRYLDEIHDDLDSCLARVEQARAAKEAVSIGLVGNCAEVLPELVRRGVAVDVLTDQTSAHDALGGYVPAEISLDDAIALRQSDPQAYIERSMNSMRVHVEAMLDLMRTGAVTFDYGNNIRGQAQAAGCADAFAFPGFVPAYVRPLFCEGRGPFRWAALSGKPADIHATDEVVLREFADNEDLCRWIRLARERVAFQGFPSRICWLGYGERARFAGILNDMVKRGELEAPIVIGRDHLDCGSVASPNRETESMLDGSDAIADWPLLNGMLNVASGASWVSIHHGGGVGIGQSIHSGQVIVADGTDEAAVRLDRVLTNDPGTGIMRHVDAGYQDAADFARQAGVKLPMAEHEARNA